VRYAYHYTIGCKSRTHQSTGSVSQRQGCSLWDEIWRKPKEDRWKSERQTNDCTNRNII